MIKNHIIGGLLLIISLTVNGQILSSFGMKTGLSLANQSYRITPIEYNMETRSITTPSMALFLEFFKGEHLSFQLDMAYVVKGSQTTTQSLTVNHLENDRVEVNSGELSASIFKTMEISPMIRYGMDQDKLNPYILVGPRLDFLLQYETDSEYPLEHYYSYILGLVGGAGVEYNLEKLGLFLEVQYQPDLSPVTNQAPLLINNNVLLFTIGIRYITSPR